jgi:glycosyltransferase involved in cell wall biosynthesis
MERYPPQFCLSLWVGPKVQTLSRTSPLTTSSLTTSSLATSPLRILHVVAGAATGGAETFSQDAILGLAERGIQQRVICRPHPIPLARFAEAGIATQTQSFSPFDRLLGGRGRVERAARHFGADLIHAWMARAASFVPRSVECPVVGWFGGYYDLKYYGGADVFVGVTKDIAQSMVDRGAPAERVFCNTTFGTLPDCPVIERQHFDTPADAKVVLVLSRLHPKKGIDTILQAVASVPGLYLWVAGEGPNRDEYLALMHQLGIADRVRFLGWRNDRKALLEACDIVALPSRYEPFGTVIIEAWSMHKPLVATRAAGASQYVRDGENGLLCPIDHVQDLASCLAKIASDKALSDRLIATAYNDYQSDFCKPVVIDRLIQTYQTAISLGKRPSNEG